MKKFVIVLGAMFLLSIANVAANKTSVELKAPEEAKTGTEITLTINVSHSANSGMHHTDWVYLKINGEEIKRWEYSRDSLPPDADFTLEFKYIVPDDLDVEKGLIVEAEGDCNLHGTAGPSEAIIKLIRENEE